MPGGFVCSGSMKRALPTRDVADAVDGERPVRKLFSKEQRAFYDVSRARRPRARRPLGPRARLRAQAADAPPDFAPQLVAEIWLYPDGSRILELSTKCAPSEALDVADQTRAFLAACGVDTSGEQHTKTRASTRILRGATSLTTHRRSWGPPVAELGGRLGHGGHAEQVRGSTTPRSSCTRSRSRRR